MAEKDIEIKLRATGGKQAAKEVQEVNQAIEEVSQTAEGAAEAVEQLNIATEKAAQQDPARKLVPAWDEVAESTDEAAQSAEDAADGMGQLDQVGRELQGMFDGLRDKLDEARQQLDDMKASSEGAAGSSGNGGLASLAGRFPQIVARVAVVVSAIRGVVRVLDEIREAMGATMEAYSESVERAAGAMEKADVQLENLRREIDQTISPASTLTGEFEKFANAQNASSEAQKQWIKNANEAAAAYDNYAKALIDAQVARGELTAEEAAERKGQLDVEAIRRQAEANVRTAETEAEATRQLSQKSKTLLDRAIMELKRAEKLAQEAGAPARTRLQRGLDLAGAAATVGAQDPADPNAARNAIEAAGGEDEVRRMIDLMTGKTGFWARWRALHGFSLETILGAGERAQLAQIMQAEADQEIEAATRQLEASTAEAREFAQQKQQEVERLRQQSEEAERRAKAAADALAQAEAKQFLTERITVPAAETRNETDRLKRQQQLAEKERRAAEKAQRERDREERREAQLAAAEAMAALQEQIKAMAPSVASQADAANAQGLKDAAALLERAGQGFADGANLGELERVMHQTARLLEGTPRAQQQIVESAISPLRAAVESFRRQMEQLQSQYSNNPNRG